MHVKITKASFIAVYLITSHVLNISENVPSLSYNTHLSGNLTEKFV